MRETSGSGRKLLVGSVLVCCYCLAIGFGPRLVLAPALGSSGAEAGAQLVASLGPGQPVEDLRRD